jgi:hypothetical protein
MLKQFGIDHTAELVSSYVDTFGTAYVLAVIIAKFDSASANPTVVRC